MEKDNYVLFRFWEKPDADDLKLKFKFIQGLFSLPFSYLVSLFMRLIFDGTNFLHIRKFPKWNKDSELQSFKDIWVGGGAERKEGPLDDDRRGHVQDTRVRRDLLQGGRQEGETRTQDRRTTTLFLIWNFPYMGKFLNTLGTVTHNGIVDVWVGGEP